MTLLKCLLYTFKGEFYLKKNTKLNIVYIVDIVDIMDILDIVDIMDLIDTMDIIDCMYIMDIMEIIDSMNIMNITAQMAMAGAVPALVITRIIRELWQARCL